jgi:hypothetical protein
MPALAAALIDMLWSVSDARPDLDHLPVSISRAETDLRRTGNTGDIVTLGLIVQQVISDSVVKRLSKSAQKQAANEVLAIAVSARNQDVAALVRAVRGVIVMAVQQPECGTGLPVVQNGNNIHIGRHFSVSFCRTLRVPDDGKTYPLPAELGHFPLHSVAEFADRVPRTWLDTGGFFLPVYQSEAMFLSFGGVSWRPNIAKVGVGKVNAVSGKPWDERIHVHEQDYLLCPEQRWLDGLNAGNGFVRQFVAMPIGQGYTVEEQVTDEDRFGGIQLVSYDPRQGVFPNEDPSEVVRRAEEERLKHVLLKECARLSEPFKSVLSLSVMGFSTEQIRLAAELPDYLVARYEATCKDIYAKSGHRKYTLGDGQTMLIKEARTEGLRQLAEIVGIAPVEQLKDILFPPQYRTEEPVMGIAAGGKIRQKVVEDPYGSSAWDENVRGAVWIHLVNSDIYQRITGKGPPEKPMDAKTYKRFAVPWFDIYAENGAALRPSRILGRIKSVFAIDQQRGTSHSPEVSIPVDANKVVRIRVLSSKEHIATLLFAAEAATSARRHKSAFRLSTAVIDLDPSNARALCVRGEAHLRLGRHEDARNDAERVIHSDSANWTARRIRAEALLMLGMPEMALAEASAALALSGGDVGLQEIIARTKVSLLSSQSRECRC